MDKSVNVRMTPEEIRLLGMACGDSRAEFVREAIMSKVLDVFRELEIGSPEKNEMGWALLDLVGSQEPQA